MNENQECDPVKVAESHGISVEQLAGVVGDIIGVTANVILKDKEHSYNKLKNIDHV